MKILLAYDDDSQIKFCESIAEAARYLEWQDIPRCQIFDSRGGICEAAPHKKGFLSSPTTVISNEPKTVNRDRLVAAIDRDLADACSSATSETSARTRELRAIRQSLMSDQAMQS